MSSPDDVLDYWFGPPGSAEFGTYREFWFGGGPKIDADIRARFLDLHEEALTGAFDHWRDARRGCLALILLFDQFPRNMFRDTPRAFATDARALELACHADAGGYFREAHAVEQQFYYLPYEHSEDIAHQRRAVELAHAMTDHPKKGDNIDFAVRHLEVIERFGRFPHRNEVLGRASTPEEIEFLENNEQYRFGRNRKDLDPPVFD